MFHWLFQIALTFLGCWCPHSVNPHVTISKCRQLSRGRTVWLSRDHKLLVECGSPWFSFLRYGEFLRWPLLVVDLFANHSRSCTYVKINDVISAYIIIIIICNGNCFQSSKYIRKERRNSQRWRLLIYAYLYTIMKSWITIERFSDEVWFSDVLLQKHMLDMCSLGGSSGDDIGIVVFKWYSYTNSLCEYTVPIEMTYLFTRSKDRSRTIIYENAWWAW